MHIDKVNENRLELGIQHMYLTDENSTKKT